MHSKSLFFSPFSFLFPRDFRFFFLFLSDSTSLFSPETRKEERDRNESFCSQLSLRTERVSLFCPRSFLDADLMRAILFHAKRRGNGQVPVRENLWREMNSLYTRIGNAQNANSVFGVFFSESFRKKGKRCPLSRNL